MPKDSRKKLYDAVSSKYDIGTFDEFNNKMDDSASRKKFYESVSKDFDLGDFSSFENKISLKKKEASLPKLGNQFAAIGKSGLLEKQVSEVPAPFVGAAGKKEYQRQEEEAIKAKKSMSDRLQKAQDVYFQSQGVNELLSSFENIQGRLKYVDVSLATNYKDDYSGARTVSASDDLTRYNQEKSNLLNERNRLSDFSNNAISSVSPYIDSEISSAIKGDNLGRFVRTVSGDVVPDEFKVDAFAKSFATKHGLKDDGYVKKLVYNKLKSKIAYEIDKPAIDKDFEKLFKSKYGVSPDQAAKNEYISMFKAGKAIDYELSNQAKALGEEMKSEIKSEVQVIESEYAPVIKNIKDEYESQISYLKADGDRLNQMYQSGQISESEYSGAINGLNSKINSINNTSKEKFEKIANEMLVRQNELSGKYDRKYKRQITELTESAKAKMSEAASKFGKSFKISKELQDKYESTWKEASSKYLAKKEAVRYGLDQVESMYFGQFAKNLLMGAGGALKTLSFMGDFDAGYVLGDYIENSFRSSSPELKSAMDLLSPTKLQASAGRMIGGMAPIIATGAAAAAVTKNAPAAVRLATTGLANYLVETSQIGGAIKEDVFVKTGSMAKAETAAKKAMDANVALLPLYAFEGLPFISDIQLGIKNMFLRSAAKAGIEFATELPQEYFQGVFEDIAKVGGDINVSSVGKEMTMDRLKNTALNIAPTTLITGGLPTFAKASSMEISKMQGKSYAAKIDMANLTPTAQQQFLFDLSLRKSNTFTKAVVSSLFSSGYISEEQMKKMESAIDQSQTIKQEAKKLGLTESQSKVYAALKFNYIQAKSEFDTTSDEGSKAVAKSNMSNALKAMNDYMNGKNPEAAVVYLANNEQYVYSFETINSLLNEKGDFYNQVMNGDINIGLLSDETNPKAIQLSNNILNLLKEKVEQDAIQKQTTSEVPVQPEARVGEEVAKGEPQAEPQSVAEGVQVAEQGKKGIEIDFPSELAVSEVKAYAKPEDNYYRPDQQLKFNQGTYEPVRIIAHPDVIKAISIGSKLSDFSGKGKTVSESDRLFAKDVAKRLGYVSDNGEGSSMLLSKAAKELAKQNRNKTEEVFVVLGSEAKPIEKAAKEVTLPSQTVEAPSITKSKIKYNPVEQVAVHQETGGSTYRVTGENLVGKPAASVSIFPERTKIVKKQVTSAILKKFAKENSDILDGNEDVLAVGTWFNSETGENMIDIVAALPKKEATRLGRDYNQIAVFDLENMEEIPTGGTGEMVEGLKPEIERVSDIRNILGEEPKRVAEVEKPKAKPTAKQKKVSSKKERLAKLINDGNIDAFLDEIAGDSDVDFSTKIVENITDNSFDAIVDEINSLGDKNILFSIDDEIKDGGRIDIKDVAKRRGIVIQPKLVKVSDFAGKPIMLTISDQLTSGDVVNPFTGNTITDLNGGLFFNYTEGNTEFAWAYTDIDTAESTLAVAKEIYNKNPELYPDGIVPVAVVKMGSDSIISNEAVARVLSDNLKSFPLSNKKKALSELVKEVKRLIDLNDKAGSKSAKKAAQSYRQILDYIKNQKTFDNVVDYNNIKSLPISVRPFLVSKFTIGSPGVGSPRITKGSVKTDVTKALLSGLPLEDARGIHLAYITNTIGEPALDNVPSRNIISFVGIDVTAEAPVQSNHPNYPFALKGKGLGIVENTHHLASVLPQAYGNAISKYLSGTAETPTKAVSQAVFGGLKDVVYRNKTLNTSNDNVAKLIGFMNIAFPSVRFFNDADSWNDIINNENVQKHIVDGVVVYGLTTNGDIYLNPNFKDLNTPIHEMGHIWVDFIQATNQQLFQRGLELVEQTEEFKAAKKQYGDTTKARKEALAILIGNRGETIANASLKSKFKKWLLGMWEYLQAKFPNLRKLNAEQIQNITIDDFIGGALRDIFSGSEIERNLSLLNMSNEFKTDINFRTKREAAIEMLNEMLSEGLISKDKYEQAMNKLTPIKSIKNADTDAKRADYGLEPRERPSRRTFKTVEEEATAAIKSGVNVYELIDSANSGSMLSDVEQAIIGIFMANKENELISINDKLELMGDSSATEFATESAKKDKILDELLLAYDAVASTGTAAARALNARKMRILQDYSLAGIISRKRKVKNNQPLTRSELAEAQKVYQNIKRAQEALDAKMQKLNEEQSKAKLKKTIPQIVNEIKLEERALKRKATKEEILAERKSIKDEISKILRKSRSELGANKIPFELIPALAKLAKNYIKEGVVNIDELVDKVHGDLSGFIDGLTKADVKRALSNYNKDNKETKEELQDKISKLNQANKKIEESEAASKKSKNAAKAGKSLDAEDYQNQADKLSEEAAQIAKSEGVDVSDKRLEAYKNRIKKRIAELKDRIARKDFSKVERDEIQLDAEAEKLKAELDKIKFDYEVELAKEELNNRNLIEKIGDSVVDVMGVPRALMATADYSAPLRQAVVATVAYPKIALEASKEMFKQSLLPEAADQWLSELYASPGYQLMKDSGLYIADIKNPKLTAKEEDFTTNLAAKIPGLGMLVGESERAYVAYLNKMRVDIFSLGVEIMQNNGKSFATNPKDYKALAAYVNDITGRGELPSKIEGAGPFLNIMFFSPRLILSRFRLLTNWINPYWYFKTPLEVKKMYAKDMGLFIAFGSAVLLAFAASGADVEDDPRSSDFGKIRYGDTRWDIWGGFQQFVRAFAQATTGETKSTVSGKVRELKSEDRAGVIGRFFRSKLAPVPSLVVDAYTGKDMMGVPFNLKEKAISMSYPLVLQSGVESMQQDGVVFGIGATYLPSILGVGVQTYSTNDFLKQGPDDDIVKLLRDKRAVAIEPNNLDRKIYDIESGNDRKMSDAEFKKYYEVWANHVKTTLKENMGEYKSMSTERFEREFNKIKSQASSIAKESVIGFSSSMKTIRLTINGELETIELSAEDVKLRKQLNDEFKAKNMRIFDRAFNRAIRDNKTPYEAEILANKELEKAANEYSKDIILKMHKRGKTYDFE